MKEGRSDTVDDEPRYFAAECLLSRDYLYKLGVYVQSCAHMEKLCSEIVCLSQGLAVETKAFEDKANSLRLLPTSELITELSKAAKSERLTSVDSSSLSSMAGWLHRYVHNRHLAVHGAHLLHGSNVRIEAAPKKGRSGWFNTEIRVIDELVADVDRLLRELTHLHKRLSSET
ncbi:hypothetical protein [Jannaschia seohaensis]|uniref:hypothetical protein n=1 Tax=Jannaschia seohaensis TaxID=475081 RepID=UPI0011B1DD20|nr:hypothetical protein [Jannaschia seohaensis]